MNIFIPEFRFEVNSVRVVFDVSSSLEVREATPTQAHHVYHVVPPESFRYYFIELNRRFLICDARTDQSVMIRNDLYGTISRRETTSEISIDTTMCSRVNKNGFADSETLLFTEENPLIIVAFELKCPTAKSNTACVSVEWRFSHQTYWISSRPYVLSHRHRSFNALRMSKDLPGGYWTCDVYIDSCLRASQPFSVVRNWTRPTPAFYDSRG